MLDFCCCHTATITDSRGYSLVAVPRLLTAVAPLATEHRQAPGMRASVVEA